MHKCNTCLCNTCALDSDDCPKNLPCLEDCQENSEPIITCDVYESDEL